MTSFSNFSYKFSVVLAIRATSWLSSILPDLGGQKNMGWMSGKMLMQAASLLFSRCLPIFLASLTEEAVI